MQIVAGFLPDVRGDDKSLEHQEQIVQLPFLSLSRAGKDLGDGNRRPAQDMPVSKETRDEPGNGNGAAEPGDDDVRVEKNLSQA